MDDKIEQLKNYAGVDWALCKELSANDEELAGQLLLMFVDTLPNDYAEVQSAFSDKDYAILTKSVHRIHGALCYCGIPALKVAAKSLENAAKSNNTEAVNDCYNTFKSEVDQLLQYSS